MNKYHIPLSYMPYSTIFATYCPQTKQRKHLQLSPASACVVLDYFLYEGVS